MDSTRRALAVKERERQKGLTLFELLGVLIILGIVAAIAVPAVAGVIKDSETNADLRMKEVTSKVVENFLNVRDQNGDCNLDSDSTKTIDIGNSLACYNVARDFGTGLDQLNGTKGHHKYVYVSTSYLKNNGYLNSIPQYLRDDKTVTFVLALYIQTNNDINGNWVVPETTVNKVDGGSYRCKDLKTFITNSTFTFPIATADPCA